MTIFCLFSASCAVQPKLPTQIVVKRIPVNADAPALEHPGSVREAEIVVDCVIVRPKTVWKKPISDSKEADGQQCQCTMKLFHGVLLYALSMYRTFGRCCALWLVAQILLPFTAPFPTCEFTDFFSGGHHPHQRSPLAPVAPPSSHVDDDYAFAPPLATASGRLKLKVVSQLDPSNAGKVTPALSRDLALSAATGEQDRLHDRTTVLRL